MNDVTKPKLQPGGVQFRVVPRGNANAKCEMGDCPGETLAILQFGVSKPYLVCRDHLIKAVLAAATMGVEGGLPWSPST